MDKALLEELYEQAQAIAKETAGKLAQYHKSVCEVFYANNPVAVDVAGLPEGAQQAQLRDIAEKFNRYQKQAGAKAMFAPEDKVKQAKEMEQIMREGNERIRKLYEEALNTGKQS